MRYSRGVLWLVTFILVLSHSKVCRFGDRPAHIVVRHPNQSLFLAQIAVCVQAVALSSNDAAAGSSQGSSAADTSNVKQAGSVLARAVVELAKLANMSPAPGRTM
jgi:hypothetical protein